MKQYLKVAIFVEEKPKQGICKQQIKHAENTF
jgi:hypothetical protein